MCSRIPSSSGAVFAFSSLTTPFATVSVCIAIASLTMAITSACGTPGAQYSSAAEGGLPGVMSAAVHRLALQWRPTSFTVVNSTPLTLPWR